MAGVFLGMIQVQVPPGVQEGQIVTVVDPNTNQPFLVQVPAGAAWACLQLRTADISAGQFAKGKVGQRWREVDIAAPGKDSQYGTLVS